MMNNIIENPHHLIIGNKYTITLPCYDDYDEGLEAEVMDIVVIGKLKYGYLLQDIKNGINIEYTYNLLKDCIIEENLL